MRTNKLVVISVATATLFLSNLAHSAEKNGQISAVELARLAKVSVDVAQQLIPAFAKLLGEHPRVPFENGRYTIGLYFDPGQDSRVSDNLDNFTAPQTFHAELVNVRDEDRGRVKFTVMADKPGRTDRARSKAFGHGDMVVIGSKAPDNAENGNYIARVDFPGGRVEFFRRNPNAKLVLKR